MVKLIGPMHSDDARGQFAKSVVFLGWRGLKTARQYKVPANPNSASQIVVRAYFTSAVLNFHELGAIDTTAWAAKASGQALSGFNKFVQFWLNALDSGYTPSTFKVLSSTPTATSINLIVITDQTVSGVLKTGTTAGTWTAQTTKALTASTQDSILITGLSSATKYYYTFSSNITSVPCDYGYGNETTS